jgi:hypothetical protein
VPAFRIELCSQFEDKILSEKFRPEWGDSSNQFLVVAQDGVGRHAGQQAALVPTLLAMEPRRHGDRTRPLFLAVLRDLPFFGVRPPPEGPAAHADDAAVVPLELLPGAGLGLAHEAYPVVNVMVTNFADFRQFSEKFGRFSCLFRPNTFKNCNFSQSRQFFEFFSPLILA